MSEPVSAGLVRLLDRIGQQLAYATVMFGVAGLMLSWRVLFIPLASPLPPLEEWGPRAALSLALNIVLLASIARWFARAPKRHVRDAPQDHVAAVREHSIRFGLKPPRIVVDRSSADRPHDNGVRLRGWADDVAIVLTSHTSVRWTKSCDVRDAHIAHELAHLWSRDLHLYYRARAVGTMSIALLLGLVGYVGIRADAPASVAESMVKIVLLGVLIFLSARAYLRFREHLADVAAMIHLDDVASIRSALTDGVETSRLSRILGTHPQPAARRAIVFNPFLLVKRTGKAYLLLGLASGLLAVATDVLVRPVFASLRVPVSSFWLAVVVVAAVVGGALGRGLLEQFIFLRASLSGAWKRLLLLFFGVVLSLCLLDPFRSLATGVQAGLGNLLALLLVVVCASACCTASCFLAVLKSKVPDITRVKRFIVGGCGFACSAVVLIATRWLMMGGIPG